MPRDLNYDPQTRPALSPGDEDGRPDLSKPSLEGLAWLLRHPAEWQKGHVWNFAKAWEVTSCGTAGCAIGIMYGAWPATLSVDDNIATLGMYKDGAFSRIFRAGMFDRRAITPSVVADRIDDYLAGRPIRYLVAGDRDGGLRSAAHGGEG